MRLVLSFEKVKNYFSVSGTWTATLSDKAGRSGSGIQ